MSLIRLTIFSVCYLALCAGETSFNQDTYVNALHSSQQSNSDSDGYFGGYNYSPAPNNEYLPISTPAPIYGPPPIEFGPPAPVYGPPQPTYYKPVPLAYHSRDHYPLLEKLKTKVNLFTIGKIILKLLIFKKIVKFIGLICLLLFLPKLKDMFKEDVSMDEDSLDSKQVETDHDALEKRIENVYDILTGALQKFPDNFEL